MKLKLAGTALVAGMLSAGANATLLTSTSPIGPGALPAGVTEIGGIVIDLLGSNGTKVVSQLAASELFVGFYGSNPGGIGTQSGFDNSIYGALGGGISEAAFRFTIYDGDTSSGNFDKNDNDLLVNGLNFGDFSSVETDETNSTGTTSFGTGLGFSNNELDTGWFYSNDAVLLSDLYHSLTVHESLTFELDDVDPGDNFFDFTQGLDGSLINVGTGPVISGPANNVPEPGSLALLALSLAGLGLHRKVIRA